MDLILLFKVTSCLHTISYISSCGTKSWTLIQDIVGRGDTVSIANRDTPLASILRIVHMVSPWRETRHVVVTTSTLRTMWVLGNILRFSKRSKLCLCIETAYTH